MQIDNLIGVQLEDVVRQLGPDVPTSGRINAATAVELKLILKRLVALRNGIYRATGGFPDGPGAAIHRMEFILFHLMTGLITPVERKR